MLEDGNVGGGESKPNTKEKVRVRGNERIGEGSVRVCICVYERECV